jgi:hypothetical protein
MLMLSFVDPDPKATSAVRQFRIAAASSTLAKALAPARTRAIPRTAFDGIVANGGDPLWHATRPIRTPLLLERSGRQAR